MGYLINFFPPCPSDVQRKGFSCTTRRGQKLTNATECFEKQKRSRHMRRICPRVCIFDEASSTSFCRNAISLPPINQICFCPGFHPKLSSDWSMRLLSNMVHKLQTYKKYDILFLTLILQHSKMYPYKAIFWNCNSYQHHR